MESQDDIGKCCTVLRVLKNATSKLRETPSASNVISNLFFIIMIFSTVFFISTFDTDSEKKSIVLSDELYIETTPTVKIAEEKKQEPAPKIEDAKKPEEDIAKSEDDKIPEPEKVDVAVETKETTTDSIKVIPLKDTKELSPRIVSKGPSNKIKSRHEDEIGVEELDNEMARVRYLSIKEYSQLKTDRFIPFERSSNKIAVR